MLTSDKNFSLLTDYKNFLINEFSFITNKNFIFLGPNIFIINIYKLPYESFLDLQEKISKFIKENPQVISYIICSHEEVFTFGKGDRQNGSEFPSLLPDNIKCFNIPRGGGLTFHFPEQWILYPIRKIDTKNWTVSDHLCWILKSVQEVISKLTDLNVEIVRNPTGLWSNNLKIASVGIHLNRYISNHGLALNIDLTDSILHKLENQTPCGLKLNQFSSLNSQLNKKIMWSEFNSAFIDYLKSYHS